MNNYMQKNRLRRILKCLIYMVLFSLLVSACSILPEEQEAVAPPLVEPPKVQYNTYTVKKGDIRIVKTGTAVFVAEKRENLSFGELEGRITSISARVGEEVKAGSVLATLESGEIENQIRQLETNIRKIKIAIQKLDNEESLSGLNMEIAQMELESARAAYMLEPNTNRLKDLKKAQLDVDQLIKRNNDRSLERQSVLLDLENAEYLLEKQKELLQRTKLICPYDAVVTYIDPAITIGEQVPKFKTIMVVSDPRYLTLEYTSELISGFKPGMEAVITYKDREYKAKIVATSDMLEEKDKKPGRFIRFMAEGLPDSVKQGDTAVFRVEMDKRENVIVIPKSGLRVSANKYYVEVISNNSKREVFVDIGLESATQVEITEGLEEGQTIIIR